MFSFWLTDISQPFSSGSFVSSCDTNNTYTTYLWPKTPFMYQGREDKIGNITEGNKYEAMGVGVQANLQATTLGEDTGVACVRAGGVPNMTLKLTGKLTYESQGLCLVGTCTYTTAVTKNFSCY
jgi:hypothetical protein